MGYRRQPYDLAVLEAPDFVREAHAQYVAAGSDFVETNTFQANRFRLPVDVDVAHLNREAVRLAREAGPEFVLGAVGPCGKPIEPIGTITREQALESFREQASALAQAGVDGFMLETFVSLDELELAVQAVREFSDRPILAAKAFIEDGETLSQGYPEECAQRIQAMEVDALGANCIVGPQRMLDLVRMLTESTSLPILAFPTPGMPQLVKGVVNYDTSPEYFAKATARLAEAGARILGGCCGTTPEHIAALRSALHRQASKPRAASTKAARETVRKEPAQSTPSRFSEKLGRQFVSAVEMDVLKGLNQDKLIAGCRCLHEHGVDVVNISDGARARLRMTPMAVSHLIQEQVGIEVTMHFSCRDRNLLAIQADLLGAHALGIRNLLAVTGDPANIGDYPSATSVFDIDAIGLVRILARFNEGRDLAGSSLGTKCAFTIAAAYNPFAIDQAGEDDRLRRKVESGANAIYTQPVFSEEGVERSINACSRLGIPVLVGVLPLRSARHCEFMHNEVPGIEVPDALRARMAQAETDADAQAIGIEEAQRLAALVRQGAQGIYLMPPFSNPGAALAVLEATR
jgi:homocysteine S-methyltransferase